MPSEPSGARGAARTGVALALLASGVALGFLADRLLSADAGPASPQPAAAVAALGAAATTDAPAFRAMSERLRAIGYVQGSAPAPQRAGVLTHVRGRVQQGTNLLASAHGPVATLIDMNGKPLHRWSVHFARLWPDAYDPSNPNHQYWRRVRLLEDGGVLAIFEGSGIVRLDRDSRVLWARRGGYHHDLRVAEDGRVFVLTREPRLIPRMHATLPVLEDSIAILDADDGNPLRELSVLEAFERSPYASLLERAETSGDIFHTNSLQLLDGRLEHRAAIFRRGNILISLAHLDVIAIVDMDREQVVWALSGMWHKQHDPVLLENGHILLFDNFAPAGGSRVLEFDPLTQQIAWSYSGDPPDSFHSNCCGTNQRLPNGNTLIAESTAGRVIEVDPAGTIVWEFINPDRVGKRREKIAYILDMQRLPAEDR